MILSFLFVIFFLSLIRSILVKFSEKIPKVEIYISITYLLTIVVTTAFIVFEYGIEIFINVDGVPIYLSIFVYLILIFFYGTCFYKIYKYMKIWCKKSAK